MNFFKEYGFRIIKWLIFLTSLYYLIDQIAFHQNLSSTFKAVSFSFYSVFLLISAILLLFVNWGLEALKWKISVKEIHPISFKTALASVFAGTSVSLFMPNRTGEFAGRIFALPKEKRTAGIFASVVTSFAQLNITLITGIIALCYSFYFYPENIFTLKYFSLIILIPLLIITLLGLLLYFKLRWFGKFFCNIKFLKKYSEKVKVLSAYSFSKLHLLLFISFVRYGVFLLQFHLLIRFFGLTIPFTESVLCIVLTFYVTTVIPTFSLSEIGVRGSAAVLFFGLFNNSGIEVIAATSLLWIINVAVPALIGNYFVAGFKENH